MAAIERRCRTDDRYLAVFTVVVLALTAVTLCFIILDLKAPLYSAAIDSVSGLDDGDLGYRSTDLNPLFNLTLRVTARSFFSRGCTHPGAVLEVTYAGVKLAAGPVQRFYAKPGKTKEQAMMAWGAAVQVPEFAFDGIAADTLSGRRVFDVAVTMPVTYESNHHGKLVSCRGLHVGDGSTLAAPCVVSDVDTVMPVATDAGTS